jgi:alpha-glucuronidase
MNRTEGFSSAWLAYRPLKNDNIKAEWAKHLGALTLPPVAAGSCLDMAQRELKAGLLSQLGLEPRCGQGDASRGLSLELTGGKSGSFALRSFPEGLRLSAADGPGLLYGSFRLLSWIAQGKGPDGLDLVETPGQETRMLDHWDNLDGSVERGYSGRSLFFRDGKVLPPRPRLRFYARLLASVGINAVCLNNVNVHDAETRLIADPQLPRLARLANLFRPYGIRLYLSANFAAPITLGDLDTADPLDPRVAAWWAERAKAIWRGIPDFGGFVVKADSEHRPGPFSYCRDQAQGANLLARAVAPYGGTIFWRCFVYDCVQDWRDRSTDRARAAYDHFHGLDGRFLPNVKLQIKNGPMDFQPREPVSPLFGAMPSTGQVLELQATQEYTGQQRQLCYLPEQWRSYLDFPIGEGPDGCLAKQVQGFVAVANVGDDANWTGHDLAQANLYGFGRLAWQPALDPIDIAREWARQTFGVAGGAAEAIVSILRGSWETYESYTTPLGVGWMVNPSHHYGPNPDGYEYDRWGTYHFADRDGVGVDRTAATGTGYAAQYRSELSAMFESLELCPEELLLFFHHVPYSYRLRKGETLIQHIYDSHFEGAERAAAMLEAWKKLEGSIDPTVYASSLSRFEHQKEQAALWRDVVNTYFYRKSGVPDERGRLVYR